MAMTNTRHCHWPPVSHGAWSFDCIVKTVFLSCKRQAKINVMTLHRLRRGTTTTSGFFRILGRRALLPRRLCQGQPWACMVCCYCCCCYCCCRCSSATTIYVRLLSVLFCCCPCCCYAWNVFLLLTPVRMENMQVNPSR